jgi:nucleoid-associated protein YgaU
MATTEYTYYQVTEAQRAANPGPIDELRRAGFVFDVADGDGLDLVATIGAFSRVRVLSGHAAGKTGVLPTDVVHPVGADRPYITRDGDSLVSIAQDFYRDPARWTVIFEANRRTIGEDPDVLQTGLGLRIPAASGLSHQ